ncbi:hypothetical protein HYPGJ_20819 [Hyphomicrobium sp. GJ21]|nr:hypothetical protein HYPGJ_20819 [Hyphomicrobium sp. GJ21]
MWEFRSNTRMRPARLNSKSRSCRFEDPSVSCWARKFAAKVADKPQFSLAQRPSAHNQSSKYNKRFGFLRIEAAACLCTDRVKSEKWARESRDRYKGGK